MNSWSNTPRIRVLVAAFASVPGVSAHTPAVEALIDSVRAEIDLVTIKTDQLSHLERFRSARMFRVPVGEGSVAEQQVVFERALGRQIEAERYDVVHVLGASQGRVAAEKKSALGFQLVYEVCSYPESLEAVQEWMAAHRTTLRAADLVLVSNDITERAVRSEGAIATQIIQPSVDVGSFDWQPIREAALPRILYLGSFGPDRNLPLLLGALTRVRKTRDVRALLAGERSLPRRETVRRWIRAHALDGAVEARGEPRRDMLPRLIAGASVCVVTAGDAPRFAHYGDVPQPLFEYLACHRPVIAPAVPGLQIFLRDEQEALLYPPTLETALAEAILEVLRDGELRERMTARGYERARSAFTCGARRRRLGEIYERLVPGSQLGDPWRESFDDADPESIAELEPTSETDPDRFPRSQTVAKAAAAFPVDSADDRASAATTVPDGTASPLESAAAAARAIVDNEAALNTQRLDPVSDEPLGVIDTPVVDTIRPLSRGDTDPGT